MCLIVLAWRVLPDLPLVVAANRDEFHARPAARAAFWQDQPGVLAGRDLEALGTWMGVARSGRFAAVTNYRGAKEPRAAESRGALVVRFLNENPSPEKYLANISRQGKAYSGFNLLAADERELWWFSNRDGAPRRLEPGFYALGNALLDDPGVDAAKARFVRTMEPGSAVDTLFAVLAEFRIVNPQYGTRCSTVLLRGKDGRIRYAERGFSAEGAELETAQYEFAAA